MDQEARIAANFRAHEALERLHERDDLNALMADAEARVRARYQDELDTIAAHWDQREAILSTYQEHELFQMDRLHTTELEAVEQMNAEELVIMASHHDALLAAEREYWGNKEAMIRAKPVDAVTDRVGPAGNFFR